MMDVNEAVLMELECVVCVEFMHPPIRMCILGHSFCDRCSKKMSVCPTCRGDKNGGRNFALENIHARIFIPCKHRYQGCYFRIPGDQLKHHEEFCKYRRRRCPLITINNCPWIGPVKDFVQHCKELHPSNVFSENQKQLVCARVRSYGIANPGAPGDDYCLLFEAYGQLFKFVWDLNSATGLTRWCLMYLGPPQDAAKYTYEIEFKNDNGVYKMGSMCQPDMCPVLQAGSHLLTHVDMLRKFCNEFGLPYKVSIYNHEGLPGVENVAVDGVNQEEIIIPQPSRCYDFNDPNLDGVRGLLCDLCGQDMDDEHIDY